MKVKIKKLIPSAVIPKYAVEGDAGLDLTATDITYDDKGNVIYSTGLAIAIPEGYMGLLFPRSSISKKRLALANSVGVIDSGYRGEIKVVFKSALLHPTMVIDFPDGTKYKVGERVAQLIIIPYPYITLQECDELPESDRGEGGFGHTGK